MREAHRKTGLAACDIPAIFVLYPDSDLVRRLRADGCTTVYRASACNHSKLAFPEGRRVIRNRWPRGRRLLCRDGSPGTASKLLPRALGMGGLVGAMSGFVGIGGDLLVEPGLMGAARMPMIIAIG
ncbi:sulfite exporter TauE/SafE family protein [Bosea vaviloviae]|uniref:sulfite exporter TauE/SafE family protein n=1 Tax=Bosea vaviloviae TaxID=1526658 RepID=UPI0018D02B12|nr:sulfite exporter TauE/SafE family protein [Bosea vaviloviae]